MLLMKKYLFLLLTLALYGCPQKGDEPISPAKTREEQINTWASLVEFEQVSIVNGIFGYKDIVFHDNTAALLDSENRIYYSYDQGKSWQEKIKIPATTLKCIALKPDGEKVFVGGVSQGPYTFGAQFWVYHTPKSGAATLDYNKLAEEAQLSDPINHDFQRASWNNDGSVYATFGRSNYTDGFFGNIVPDGRNKFMLRNPSHSRINDKTPSKAPTHYAGFYINNSSEHTVICGYEYVSTARMNIVMPYQSSNKGILNSWFSLALYWGDADLVYHMGQDPKGKHIIYVSQANRLFYEGKYAITYKNIQGDLQCAAIDKNNFIWVGTNRGMFKSKHVIPHFN
jgi:hypothetical protein